jgi:hypothetical protein
MRSGRLSSAVHPSRSNASRIRAHASPGCTGGDEHQGDVVGVLGVDEGIDVDLEGA